MTQNPWAEEIRAKLLARYGYSDRRIKNVAKMTAWGFGFPLRYHSSCAVNAMIRDDGDLDVLVVGDAPLDSVVENTVKASGGSIGERPRGPYESAGRHLAFTASAKTCDRILAVADALDGLPSRHAFDRNHYFYSAPVAAKLLRELHGVLTSSP